MAMLLNPYLGFSGQARDALAFYTSVFGGEATIMTFAEGGMPHEPGQENLIMHAQLTTPDGFTLMLSDGSRTPGAFQDGYSISVSGNEDEKLKGIWDALSEGGEIMQPYVTAPWGDKFGMLRDKFGINWMLNSGGTGN
jgi:PhnB protein